LTKPEKSAVSVRVWCIDSVVRRSLLLCLTSKLQNSLWQWLLNRKAFRSVFYAIAWHWGVTGVPKRPPCTPRFVLA